AAHGIGGVLTHGLQVGHQHPQRVEKLPFRSPAFRKKFPGGGETRAGPLVGRSPHAGEKQAVTEEGVHGVPRMECSLRNVHSSFHPHAPVCRRLTAVTEGTLRIRSMASSS